MPPTFLYNYHEKVHVAYQALYLIANGSHLAFSPSRAHSYPFLVEGVS